ncbi:MAG: enoyl-CoA hydratase/isomerase family protein [Saprospiraceae bacterium]|nr:enoyl-CoA hydratase/isomerase family protein [Saprospiraceae bacterium]
MESYVKSTVQADRIIIEFFHPAGNSLPATLLTQLVTQINAANKERPNVILLKSAGDRTFCAGASFDELMSIKDEKEGLLFFSGFANVINAIRKSNKIVLTRVQGKAVGGGVGLIAASDHVIATRFASIRLSELAVGIGPFVIGPAVERKAGLSAFTKMSLTPDEWQTAEWAKQHNLLQEVFDTIDQVDQYIESLIQRWNSYSPDAMAELKKIFWEGTQHWDTLLSERAAISGKLVLSEFTRQAIAKFKSN